MADVTIEAAAGALQGRSLRGGVFWTSPTVGYVIYLNATYDLVYRKTVNGGAGWGAAQVVVAAAACDALSYDCWADWQTAGDAGTKIHIAYISADLNQIRYVYLDTSTDTVAGDDLIETCQGTGTFTANPFYGYTTVSISKTRGGNLVVALEYQDNAPTYFNSFYTSPDADTWTSKASPYEVLSDQCLLFPGNEADNQDVWGIYRDRSTDEISLKTFDDSGNSWSEQAISGGMVGTTQTMQMDGAIRLSDGHLILAAWSGYNVGTADLMTWDINGAGSITAKTNIITDTAEYVLVSVFVNQVNDDIYVAYVGGTAFGTLVKVFYQLSQDGGANWDGQAAMQADAEDDEWWISAGAAKKEWGGKFQPVWFNEDLRDLFTNTDNGISIAAAGIDHTKILGDTINLSDTVTKAVGQPQADSVAIADAVVKAIGVFEADSLAITDALSKGVGQPQGDNLGITDALIKGIGLVEIDSLAIADAISKETGLPFSDSVAIADILGKNVGVSKADLMVIDDALSKAIGIARTEAITIADSISIRKYLGILILLRIYNRIIEPLRVRNIDFIVKVPEK